MITPVPQGAGELSPLEALVAHDEANRPAVLEAHPELASPSTVGQLTSEANRLLRIDLDLAARTAATSVWLADRLEHAESQGRSRRAQANVLHVQGHYSEALVLYRRALSWLDGAGLELEMAITRSSGLQSLIYLGDYEEAFEWAQAARRTFEAAGDRMRLARLESNVGNIYARQDRFNEALDCYGRALEHFRQVDSPIDVATSLHNIAVCQISLNNFFAALSAYDQARREFERQKLPLGVLEMDYNIAYLYYLRGEYTRSIQLYQKARTQAEELGDPQRKGLCDLDQAEIFLELNLVEEASQLSEWAFEAFDELGMNYEAGKALTFLAIAVSRQGKVFLALDLLTRAHEMFESEQNLTWPALIDLYRALILNGEGRYFEARRLSEGAVAVFSDAGQTTKWAMAEVLLARLDLEDDRLDESLRRCARVIERLAPLEVPVQEFQAWFVKAQAEERAGRPEDALAAYQQAHLKLETLRGHLQTDELKITFLEDKLVVYESLVDLLVGALPSAASTRSAFEYIEKAKSRSLADLMSFRAHSLPATNETRSDLAEQVRNLREELNWYYRQLDLEQMRRGEGSAKKLDKLREHSHRREEQLLRTLRDLQATDQEFRTLQDAATVELEEIQASLPPDTRLLEYYVARGTVYAAVMDATGLVIEPVSVVSRIRELYRLLQFQLSKFLLGRDYVAEYRELIEEATTAHLAALHEELVAPLARRLDGERLVVVPHDVLHHVPFHALFDGERHLIERTEVSYAPSASVRHLCAVKNVAVEPRSLVLGVPDEKTPHIRTEVETVAAVLGDARLAVGPLATEALLRSVGPRARVVHLSTHGIFRRDNPMFSAIQLGDSRLSLFDLYGLQLPTELVTLSGCGTGLSVVVGGDELVGLVRGLLYAGARSVLATLWDVQDESTARFMELFYAKFQAGGRPAEAMRHAMLELRAEYPHPYYWAPFLLVGQG